ncbi:hypothetical protein ECG_08060 [Echinococcus granulosus]|nr:hypothetical protein ECG_08060 [Echinococcus granulosus]
MQADKLPQTTQPCTPQWKRGVFFTRLFIYPGSVHSPAHPFFKKVNPSNPQSIHTRSAYLGLIHPPIHSSSALSGPDGTIPQPSCPHQTQPSVCLSITHF